MEKRTNEEVYELLANFYFNKELDHLAKTLDEEDTLIALINEGESLNYGKLKKGLNYAFVIDWDGNFTAYRERDMDELIESIRNKELYNKLQNKMESE